MVKFIIGVFLFALAFALVYSWGYVKQQKKNQELFDQLIRKSQERVLREMKKGKALSKKDIGKIIEGTKSSLFWSKNKMQVTNSKVFTDPLIKSMLSQGLITEVLEKGIKKYKIKS